MSTDRSGALLIVGAGSAGCVLANRLSADGNRRVILVEAGPDYGPADELPQDLKRGGRNSFHAHDWGYEHQPNRQQWKLPLPRGRVVGGSSSVNTCIAIRGQPEDYEEWKLPDWSWDDCLRNFRRLERDLDFPDAPWHGNDGPMLLRRHAPSEWTTWQGAFVEACRQIGHPDCEDTNEPGSVGVGAHTMNKIGGRRVSAAEAYLNRDVRARENLDISPDALVRRLVFDGRRVVGAEVERAGHVATIDAEEVIVATGAINTPHLLMRSGIGPRLILERWGVDVVAESPRVGAQLLDHPGVAMFLRPRLFKGTSASDDLIQTTCRYASGTTAMPNDLIMQPGATVATPWLTLPLVSVMVMVPKPVGRGSITWESADPRAQPHVESALLDNVTDRHLAVDALEHCFEVASQPVMRDLARPIYPSTRVLSDRRRLEDKIRDVCDSGYHPCGTVQMGSDRRDPCDPRGRVRGTQGLRVVDASLMPTIPHANIHLTVLMMAERIAEWMTDTDGSITSAE